MTSSRTWWRVEVLSEQEGVSVNQFIATAVAEKLTAISTVQFFEERRERADFQAFRRLMRRKRGQSPRSGMSLVDQRGVKSYNGVTGLPW